MVVGAWALKQDVFCVFRHRTARTGDLFLEQWRKIWAFELEAVRTSEGVAHGIGKGWLARREERGVCILGPCF